MLIELHVLQNHAPSNLNRDDTGSPKQCVFGGVKRARISSQCLKRSIRRSTTFQDALEGHLATRTRQLPEIIRARFNAEELNEYAQDAAIKATGFGTSDGKERPAEKDGKFATAQTMFLTQHDIDAVAEVLLTAAREAGSLKKFTEAKSEYTAAELQKKARQQGFRPVTVDMALFGRMTTSEAFRDVEAAMQVAHAISVNKIDHEFDYFTAVDDLKGSGEDEEDAGADMLGDVEYTSACYYKYFSLDVDDLVANLTGASTRSKNAREIPAEETAAARELAAITVETFVRAMALTAPTGKQNSFAAHQLPAAVLVEVRPHAQPVSYANAFVKPARVFGENDLVEDALGKLQKHVEALTVAYNLPSEARLLLTPEHETEIVGVQRVASLNALCEQLGALVRDGSREGADA